MTVISVSLTPELLERLDTFVEKSGFSSRSEALRLAVRDSLSQFSLQSRQMGQVMSTVTIISETESASSHLGILDLRNGFDNIIFGNMHLHIEEGLCIEIFLVKGDSEIVMNFVTRSKTVKGVREVNYTLTPLTG
ncbi:CopG family ribbon-helix-helix protein [Candidatus Bathyarchaeota archaeon]|jgi:CopG family nickel-responsive transcriptional regulator|nr:CopG family ribbon-helix-helix protein [Candidatus Bathyarchaeota archaeon]